MPVNALLTPSEQSRTLLLRRSVRNQPISRRGLDWLIKGYGKKAKLPDDKQHFHVLKHSIATHLLDAGAEAPFRAGLARSQQHSEHRHLYVSDFTDQDQTARGLF